MKKIIKIALITILLFAVAGLLGLLIFLNSIASTVTLDDLDKNKLVAKYSNIDVYDNDNNIISKATSIAKIDELHDYTKNAFIAIEDKEFYNHSGLNYKRIVGAMINNIKSGSFSEGASTISQQLVKNTQLSSDKTIERKIKEMYITQELEKEYSKNEILEMYLNNIYFGASAYGIENASLTYFGKSAKDLTIAQSAVLAGLIKSPGTYSPINNIDKCIARRNIVLKEMLKDGYIDDTQFNDAISEEITLYSSNILDNQDNLSANYDYIQKALLEASQILNISIDAIRDNGYKIYTYMDQEMQNTVYDIINSEKYIVKNSNGKDCQGLLVVIDNKTNNICAFASNTNYDMSNLVRQPGSAIKPIMVYAPALDCGIINPMTKILDEEINIDGYKPHNVGNVYHGYTSIRDSVAYSLNIPAVKIMQELGVDYCKDYAKQFNINFEESDNGLALALGGFSQGVTLDTLTNAYTTFANLGYFAPQTTIKEIKNKYGMTIYKDCRIKSKIINDDTAYLTTSLLIDGVKYGTSKRLNTLKVDIAGKTGTVAVSGTNKNSDAISIAYTTDYTVGSWLGNYTFENACNLDSSNNGGTYATSAVRDTFRYLNSIKAPQTFVVPDSVVKCKINNMQYMRDNVVTLASSTIDERYIIEDYFSKRFLPSDDGFVIKDCNINVEYHDSENIAIISLDILDSYVYELYRVKDGKQEQLEILNGTITDSNLEYNTTYTYFVKYKSIEEKQYHISNKVSITTKNKAKNNQFVVNDYNWLFN